MTKAFDRHEILRTHYRGQISSWDWESIVDQLDTRSRYDCEQNDCGDYLAFFWLGSVYALTPSGKVYAFWTTNQSRSDITRDAAWWDALNDVANERKCFVGSPEFADSDQIFVCKQVWFEEEDDE